MFIQIKDGQPYGYPVTYENMRMVLPKDAVIPPYPLTKDVLKYGFALYEYAQKPDLPLSDFKVVEEGKPIWTSDQIRGDYITQVWVIRDMTPEERAQAVQEQWQIVINEKDFRLWKSDWSQLPDVPLTPEQVQEWRVYRQQLRDIPQQTDPFHIVWPIPPNS